MHHKHMLRVLNTIEDLLVRHEWTTKPGHDAEIVVAGRPIAKTVSEAADCFAELGNPECVRLTLDGAIVWALAANEDFIDVYPEEYDPPEHVMETICRGGIWHPVMADCAFGSPGARFNARLMALRAVHDAKWQIVYDRELLV